MLTNEQIRKLKNGDQLIAEVTFCRVDYNDEDLICSSPATTVMQTSTSVYSFFNPSCLSLPPAEPKYDPCRKFKKGDKVRVVERHGRYQPNIPVDELWKGLCTVAEDEDFCNNLVKVRSEDGREKLSHWWYLELVTPVEDLEPYFVLDSPNTYNICKHGESGFAATFYKKYPIARKLADEYCAALNAANRKEQQ